MNLLVSLKSTRFLRRLFSITISLAIEFFILNSETSFLKFFPSLRKRAGDFHDILYYFMRSRRNFAITLMFSFLIQILNNMSFIMAAKAFGIHSGFGVFFALVPIISIVAMIPVTVGGLGTREAASLYFFFSSRNSEKRVSWHISGKLCRPFYYGYFRGNCICCFLS